MALTLHGTVSDNTVALDRKTATPLIINGDMAIAQRGTSVTGITTVGYYTVDRFYFFEATDGTYTMSQDTDVPSGQGFSNSLKINTTTADTSITSTQSLRLRHTVEAQNLQHLKFGTANAESITLSFWIKSKTTGNFVVRIISSDSNRHICKLISINSADTWEKKTITFVGDTTGVINNDNGAGFIIEQWFAAGPDISSGTLPTTWATNITADSAVGQTVNLADSTSNYINITGVQLEVGTFDANSIPPFQFEDVGTSLARCQRYYQKSYQANVAPSTSTDVGLRTFFLDGTAFRTHVMFLNRMRTSPTLTIYDSVGNSGKIRVDATNNVTFTGTRDVSESGFSCDQNIATSGQAARLHFTANAEL